MIRKFKNYSTFYIAVYSMKKINLKINKKKFLKEITLIDLLLEKSRHNN